VAVYKCVYLFIVIFLYFKTKLYLPMPTVVGFYLRLSVCLSVCFSARYLINRCS